MFQEHKHPTLRNAANLRTQKKTELGGGDGKMKMKMKMKVKKIFYLKI